MDHPFQRPEDDARGLQAQFRRWADDPAVRRSNEDLEVVRLRNLVETMFGSDRDGREAFRLQFERIAVRHADTPEEKHMRDRRLRNLIRRHHQLFLP